MRKAEHDTTRKWKDKKVKELRSMANNKLEKWKGDNIGKSGKGGKLAK